MAPRRLPAVLLVFLTVVLTAGAAPQQSGDDAVTVAAEELRRDPVYVDPDAERALTGAETDELREQIRSSDVPVFVAVLPAGAGDVDDVARRLPEETGLSGTYAAVVGDGFRATSTDVARADELASAAFQAESSGGAADVLLRFVELVGAESSGTPISPDGGTGGSAPPRDDDGGSALVPLGLLVAGGAGLWAWSRRRRRREAAEMRARVVADAELVRAELSVVADDILRLEPEVDLHPEARNDYEAAVERHRVASAALDYADEPVDLVRVDRVVTEARYAMSRAKAQLEGREPPPPPDDLRRPGRHREPPVDVDEQGVPVYAGGAPFYGGGWYGGGGGALRGPFLGG